MRKKIFIRLVFFVLVILGLVYSFIWFFGTFRPEHRQYEEFSFTRDYIDSLHSVFIAEKMLKKSSQLMPKDTTVTDMSYAEAFAKVNDNLLKAKNMIKKYENSSNNYINRLVSSSLALYDSLIKADSESIALHEETYNSKMQNEYKSSDRSKEMIRKEWKAKVNNSVNRVAKLGELENNKVIIMNHLRNLSSVVDYLLISDNSCRHPSIKRTCTLVITSQQREELINKLINAFGQDIKKEQDTRSRNNSHKNILVAAQTIYKVLINEKTKSADGL